LALDGASQSLEIARREALEKGISNIHFEKADVERLSLPVVTFDVVLMNMSLHHVRGLRRLLHQVRRSLRPGGIFLINEFIGRRQFQFPNLQLRIVSDLLSALPSEWRVAVTGKLKTQYVRRSVEYWNAVDPSEAIRSDRILAELTRQFRIIERHDYGGTILNLLLEDIIHNFDPTDNKDVGVVRLLAKFEEILIREGVLTSDFSMIAARPFALAFGQQGLIGQQIQFGHGGGAKPYQTFGWSRTEEKFTWTEDNSAQLWISIGTEKGPFNLKIRLAAFTHLPELPSQPVEVFVDEHKVAEWRVTSQPEEYSVMVADDQVKAGGTLEIKIRTPKAISPKSVGLNDDERVLGACFLSLELTKD
jgi:SAM-dependent methyltransferase